MPLFSIDDGKRSCGQLPGDVRAQRVEAADQADVAVLPQLQPGGQGEVAAAALAGDDQACAGSMPSSSACACTHFRPDTQSFRPAGNGATSGADDGVTQLRKSTIATATPWLAMIRPHERYMPSKHDIARHAAAVDVVDARQRRRRDCGRMNWILIVLPSGDDVNSTVRDVEAGRRRDGLVVEQVEHGRHLLGLGHRLRWLTSASSSSRLATSACPARERPHHRLDARIDPWIVFDLAHGNPPVRERHGPGGAGRRTASLAPSSGISVGPPGRRRPDLRRVPCPSGRCRPVPTGRAGRGQRGPRAD